jgi:CheY-like chemotaxis protein
VILVSQRSRSTDIESGLAAGADEYIVKGVLEQQKLLEAVAARL